MRPDRISIGQVATVAAAATIGGWLRGVVAGWPWEGAAVTLGLVGWAAWRDQKRRRLRYPPADEPTWPVPSLYVDGSPCRGWPSLAVAARMVETIERQLEGDRDPWQR